MINSLLERISGFLSKEFLFASLVPVVFAYLAAAALFSAAVGFGNALAFLEYRSIVQLVFMAVNTGAAIVVSAYVLSALRPVLLALWCGSLGLPWLDWIWLPLQRRHEGRYFRMREATFRQPVYESMFSAYMDRIRESSDNSRPRVPTKELAKHMKAMRALSLRDAPIADVRAQLEDMVRLHVQFSPNSLVPLFQVFRFLQQSLVDREHSQIWGSMVHLDRCYGLSGSIAPTELGNVVAAYDAYPFKRYGVEGDFLWSRLHQVIPPEFLASIQDRRIMLDFALAMATMSSTLTLVELIAGPWQWNATTLWVSIVTLLAVVSYLFYRIAIVAARGFGVLLRAACDLFRLDLMHALQRPRPSNLEEERRLWTELGQLSLYGNVKRPEEFRLRWRR